MDHVRIELRNSNKHSHHSWNYSHYCWYCHHHLQLHLDCCFIAFWFISSFYFQFGKASTHSRDLRMWISWPKNKVVSLEIHCCFELDSNEKLRLNSTEVSKRKVQLVKYNFNNLIVKVKSRIKQKPIELIKTYVCHSCTREAKQRLILHVFDWISFIFKRKNSIRIFFCSQGNQSEKINIHWLFWS